MRKSGSSVASDGVSNGLQYEPDAESEQIGSIISDVIDAVESESDDIDDTDVPTVGTLRSGVRFLYQNDLDWTRAINPANRQPGYLLLTGSMSFEDADNACQALGENLALAPIASLDEGLRRQLTYLSSEGFYTEGQTFWAEGGAIVFSKQQTLSFIPLDGPGSVTGDNGDEPDLPAICTQTAPLSTAELTDNSDQWQLGARSGQLSVLGFRDALSFRFGSVPYADTPRRFERSSPLSKRSGTIQAISNDAALACPQYNGGNWDEDGCLVANIATTWLPSPREQALGKGLRPVFIFIHGGGFRTGSGLDPTFAGGNMASRSDIVVITPNYRLGTLGWLALADSDKVPGNFGLGDIISLLKWVQQHAHSFGGDPHRVTVAGQSSGAQLVQLLLRSPAAKGLFHRAIVQSGRPYDRANQRQEISTAGKTQGSPVVRELGCNPDADDVLDCLRALPPARFLRGRTMSSPVVDNDLIDDAQLDLSPPGSASGFVNRVPVMQGYMRDELASLGSVPPVTALDLATALKDAGISKGNRSIVLDHPQDFKLDLLEKGAQGLAVEVATDILSISRCGQEASLHTMATNNVFPALYGYVFDSKSYQIDWDPHLVCSGSSDLAQLGYHCHSGDLFPVFATLYYWQKPYRVGDLNWIRGITDQWASFIRSANPSPSKSYLAARGYDPPAGIPWAPMRPSSQNIISLGQVQQLKALDQFASQCNVLNRPLTYISSQSR
ncbi:alpha/beta-hydrolase [Tilletiaria anomala UBC 951]|uniref:Alpha/beta-hydrolase n=1 Tax=Tilletiaria anomala (strain ATCC 24038 / CBS 436.72 / UBC 951) TaxID=1037660 RepID=A0A066VS39_TILAU|nr:alpha/beta-hydrolase [Tilletiaria anomala UBC 951]KDN43098.1 alpha/beta-hydrolase [Tilletiaria anomala UBC 951]